MRSFALLLLFAPAALAQAAGDDDLGSAFGPPPPPKAFVAEHNVPPPPLPDDPNSELRATFVVNLAAAQKALDGKKPAVARDLLASMEINAIALGAPERVRVHRLQHAAAQALGDKAGQKDASEKWLTACGPNEVPACRGAALDAIAAFDKVAADRVRAADACVVAAEAKPGKAPTPCVDSAAPLYQKAGDALMVARVELIRARALAADGKKKPAKDAFTRLGAPGDDQTAGVRKTALEALSALELEAGAVEPAVKAALGAAGAWASMLPPERRAWVRSPAVDAACAAWDKQKGDGACHALEKKLLGNYAFKDFSVDHLGDGLSHDSLVAVNAHYGVLIQDCLAAEIRRIQGVAAVFYRVKWLVLNDGHVDEMHTEGGDGDKSLFSKCLREQFGYWRYPRHEGDPQRVEQGFTVKSSTRTWEETETE